MNKLSHDALKNALDRLEAQLPNMIRDFDEAHIMDAIAAEVDIIERDVSEEDSTFFKNRLQCMLRDEGLIPGDDEPCDKHEPKR